MAEELATAAVFGDLTQAVAARLHLEAAGIPAFLADELVANSLFFLAPAVGGIKLQVPESRLEEALRSLDERTPGTGAAIDWSDVDVGGPEPEEAAGKPTPPERPAAAPTAAPVDLSEELTLREQQAEWLLRSWIFGVVFFPIMIFILMQLVWVFFGSDERLRPEYRRKARLAAAFILPATALLLLVIVVLCGAMRG